MYAPAFMLSLHRFVLHGISCQVPYSELAGEVTFSPDKQSANVFKAVFEVVRLVTTPRVDKFVGQLRNALQFKGVD